MSKKRRILKCGFHLLGISTIAVGCYFNSFFAGKVDFAQNAKDQELYNFKKSYEYQTIVDEKMDALQLKYANREIKHADYVAESERLASEEYVLELFKENATEEELLAINELQAEINANKTKQNVAITAIALGSAVEAANILESINHDKKGR